jgi:hypothetical protein
MNEPLASDPNVSQTIVCRVVRGHQVASGINGDPRFPLGTLRMQAPHFLALGLDIYAFHFGTLNVSIAPLQYSVLEPRITFRGVKWHPIEPAEDFSFFDCCLVVPGTTSIPGLVYYPHPATKREHFQSPEVLELLLPFVEGLSYGMSLTIRIPSSQILIESPATGPD